VSAIQEATWSTTDLCDDNPESTAVLRLAMGQYGARRAFAGPVATVVCYEDNVLVRKAISEPGEGRVLVVDGGGSCRVALMGDAMVELAAGNGWAGVVLNAAVRDITRLRELEIGVRALGVTPRRSLKLGRGQRDCAVTFGGILIEPGQLLYSDDDGIVVMSSTGGGADAPAER
jgi:regulator of ribonuclease activity A